MRDRSSNALRAHPEWRSKPRRPARGFAPPWREPLMSHERMLIPTRAAIQRVNDVFGLAPGSGDGTRTSPPPFTRPEGAPMSARKPAPRRRLRARSATDEQLPTGQRRRASKADTSGNGIRPWCRRCRRAGVSRPISDRESLVADLDHAALRVAKACPTLASSLRAHAQRLCEHPTIGDRGLCLRCLANTKEQG